MTSVRSTKYERILNAYYGFLDEIPDAAARPSFSR